MRGVTKHFGEGAGRVFFGDEIKRGVHRGVFPMPLALAARADHGFQQPVRMMDALGVAGDFGANHACSVGLPLRAMHASDGFGIEQLNIQRAG